MGDYPRPSSRNSEDQPKELYIRPIGGQKDELIPSNNLSDKSWFNTLPWFSQGPPLSKLGSILAIDWEVDVFSLWNITEYCLCSRPAQPPQF